MKKFFSVFASILLLFSLATPLASAQEMPISLIIDGNTIECDVPPQIVDGHTLVPLRAVYEALGAVIIVWDESTSTVHAGYKEDIISLQIGSDKLFIADEIIPLDVPARVIGDRTMVSMRTIADSLQCKVDWLEDSQQVVITK